MKENLKLINIKWKLKEGHEDDFDSKEDIISFLKELPGEELIDTELCDEIIYEDLNENYDASNFYIDLEKTLVEEFENEYSPAKIVSYELVGLREHVEKYKQDWFDFIERLEKMLLDETT